MAPIKFEEDMRDRLEKRTIKPSAKSWATLSNRLDNQEKKSNKKGFWWLGIAASIVGVLLVSSVFFNSEVKNIESIVVEDNAINDTLKFETPKQIIDIPKQKIIVETEIIKNNFERTNEKTKRSSNNLIVNISKKTIIEKPILNEKSAIEKEAIAINTQNEADNIKSLQSENITVLDETEKLLSEALAKINNNEIKQIDAESLLSDVETDLDQSLRTKIFIKIKENVSTLADVIAERNN